MIKVVSVVLLLCAAVACAEPRVQPRRAVSATSGLVSPNHPYLFLTVPRGRSGAIVQGFEVVEQDDDDDDEAAAMDDDDQQMDDDEEEDDEEEEDPVPQRFVVAAVEKAVDEDDDDDDDVDEEEDEVQQVQQVPKGGRRPAMQLALRNAKPTHMMVPRDQAGAIMVPDGIIEIEGQSVIDEKTGKAALLVPRAALDAIPDGSVVALMERSADAAGEARANRVVVRRRRKGSRRNLKRRGGNRRLRRRGGNRRIRRINNRRNVRVVRTGGGGVRRGRRGSRRGNRPMVIQG